MLILRTLARGQPLHGFEIARWIEQVSDEVLEVEEGSLDPMRCGDDLVQIERSIQVCRRIFGGMLNIARGNTRYRSAVSLRHAAESALAILREGLERRGVRLVVDIPHDLPPLCGVQADVEQLLLNLVSNARDATRAGDQLTIRAASDGATFTTSAAEPTVAVTDAGGTFNGQPFQATATVAGVIAGVDNTPGASLEGVGLMPRHAATS